MKNYLILFLIIASCTLQNTETETRLTKAIPANSDIIIKFHDINKVVEKINKFKWWSQLKSLDVIKSNLERIDLLCSKYKFTEIIKNKKTYITSAKLDQNNNEFLIITSITELEAKSNKLMKTIHSNQNVPKNYEGININHVKIGAKNEDVFFSQYNEMLIISFSEIMIEESIRQLKYGTDIFQVEPIRKLDQNLPKYSDLNILVKTQLIEKIIGHKNIFINSNTWSWFDVELETTSILLNGVTNRGNIKYLADSEYSNAKKSTIENILPRHVKAYYSYQINTSSDLNELMKTMTDGVHENIYHLTKNTWMPQEINIVYDDHAFWKKSHIVCKPKNKNEALDFFNTEYNIVNHNSYMNYDIIEIEKFKTNNWLNTLTQNWQNIFYTSIKDYIVFSSSIKKIKSLINNKISNQTIGQNQSIKTINNKVGNKSHTSFYLNFPKNTKKWKKIFNSIVSRNTASKNYFFNSMILLHETPRFANPTTWKFSLENETSYPPQITMNHYSKELEVISQDINNTLYLINNNGKLLWKKDIGHKIISKIHQIDRYKNNKLQYLFNTKDSIYLIDRNGKNVAPFPIRGSQTMSIPLAVFDYDNNRNYRIIIPMGNEIKMYNANGEIISGWEFLKTESAISHTPEHYQVFNKDYIMISEMNGKTHLLNRKGQARTLLSSKINRTNAPVNLLQGASAHDSKLIMQTKEGKIIYVYFDGRIDTLNISNVKNQDIYIANNNYSLITQDNKMSFTSDQNRFEYIFKSSSLSMPKIFHYGESMIIAVKNEDENLIYLFDEKGNLHGNPFFGTTDFSIGKMGKEEKLNLVVGSHEGLIYNYQIN